MAKPAKSIPAATEAAAKPKSKKLMVIIIAALGLLIVIGVAGWYFTKGSSHTETAKPSLELAPKFIKLDTFTVNLRHGEGEEERVLQTVINLEVHSTELEERIKQYMPKIFNNVLILLSKKRASELSAPEGKQQLAKEIKAEVEVVLGLRAAPVAASAPAAHEGNAAPGTEATPLAADASTAHEGNAAPGTEATPPAAPVRPAPAAAHDSEKDTGIVSVLFTSFIIQ